MADEADPSSKVSARSRHVRSRRPAHVYYSAPGADHIPTSMLGILKRPHIQLIRLWWRKATFRQRMKLPSERETGVQGSISEDSRVSG